MDNLRFKTSKSKIPFYCIKNEIIDDYCIFVNLTQLFYQFSTFSTRESPPQHFLVFYSPIFIEDSISKYPDLSLIFTRFFKTRMIGTKSQIKSYHSIQHSLYHPPYSKLRRQVLLSFTLAYFFSQLFSLGFFSVFKYSYFFFSHILSIFTISLSEESQIK